jgi:hypothetical protein
VALGFESVPFLAHFNEGGEGGLAFRGFFAFALTTGEFDTVMVDGAFEEAVVIGTGGRDDVILGRLGGNRLKEFLKFAFGILERGNHGQSADCAMELTQDEFTGGIKTAIKKNRTEKGFKCIRESRRPVAAAVEFFTPTQDELLPEAKLAGVFGESAAIDQFGAGLRQRAFAKRWEILVEFASKDELEDGVAKEFEPLIGLDWNALLMGD